MALWQARTQALSAGDFVTFLTAALMLLAPLRHLAALNGPVARMMAAGESVFAMIDSDSEAETGGQVVERATGQVRFEAVSFAYPGATTAAEARCEHFLNGCLGTKFQRATNTAKATVGFVVVEVNRIDDAHACEGDPLLILQPCNVIDNAKT
jgi:ABC-type multidrug transport system fused ATPase/permease subunit